MNTNEHIKDITKFSNYLNENIFNEHYEDLKYINNKIEKALKGYNNFLGIDFCDVGANGIQIRGHHKEISGYTFGEQPTIKYDFSNIEEATQEFIDKWKSCDNNEYITTFKSSLEVGEKYGWD